MLFRLISIAGAFIGGLFLPTRYFQKVVGLALFGFNIHGTTTEENIQRFIEFYRNESAGVVLFNHPTFYDYAILIHAFGNYFHIVAAKHNLFFPFNRVAYRFGAIPIQANTGASQIIKYRIETRQPNTPILTMSPSGGDSALSHPTRLAPFKTGAFIAKSPVLPIVIRYKPHESWKYKRSLLQEMLHRVIGRTIYYEITVLPSMKPFPTETLDEFKNRVKEQMEQVPSIEK